MSANPRDVVVTGIGLVTALGVGREAHAAIIAGSNAPAPVFDTERHPPYLVHALPEIDWSAQIPRKDQRQMENWQRLGVFAAGLALDDAGLKDNAEACASMDMIVAAGGGERDVAVDTLIIEEGRSRNDRDVLINERLTTELRPTLFLAQLSNLLAGNISIVHKVTGSSRTFMGEEGAGVSAVETAYHRIVAGQSDCCLVGGAFIGERLDMILMIEGMQGLCKKGWTPFWDREAADGGMNLGSSGAFLVLESAEAAERRGARAYARLSAVHGDRGPRDGGKLEQRLEAMTANARAEGPGTALFCGATGFPDLSRRERMVLEKAYPGSALRTYPAVTGHTVEAQFTTGIALACLALSSDRPCAPFDPASDIPMQEPASTAIVTTVGHQRGEGIARLDRL